MEYKYETEVKLASRKEGCVWRGVEIQTQLPVIIKSVCDKEACVQPREKIQTVKNTLLHLETINPNIVRVVDIVYGEELGFYQDNAPFGDDFPQGPLPSELYFVFEHYNYDLSDLIQDTSKLYLNKSAKNFLGQMLRALDGLTRETAHGSLQPQNFLVDTKTQVIKLTDLGFSKSLELPVPQFVTQKNCYIAPEVLLGLDHSKKECDVWAVGCIFGEILVKEPLFVGVTREETMVNIIRTIGFPTDEEIPGATKALEKLFNSEVPTIVHVPLSTRFPDINLEEMRMLSVMLGWAKRSSNLTAARDDYFRRGIKRKTM